MSDDIVENLKKTSAWLRVLLTLAFCVALYVTGVVLLVIILAQLLFSLITGSDNSNLRRLGAGLSAYVGQMLSFMTFSSSERPFPFAPFPVVEAEAEPKAKPEAEADAPSQNRAQTVSTPSAETTAARPDPEPDLESGSAVDDNPSADTTSEQDNDAIPPRTDT